MDNYGVKLVYQYTVMGAPNPHLLDEHYDSEFDFFEESILLVRAESFEEALSRASEIAKKNVEAYPNIYGQTVAKTFCGAVDCFLMADKLETGTELYATFKKVRHPASSDEFLARSYDAELDNTEPLYKLRQSDAHLK